MARKSFLTDDDRREIARKYNEGATWVTLAREYKCRFYLIKAITQEAGIEPRKPVNVNTPIECRLHDALMKVGIGFTTQKCLVGRYVVDISIHQAPIVIEADGARHRAGTQAQQRDAIRDAAHEAAGYRVFRFTGGEINSDAMKCIQQVIDACGLVPDEEPVYDIRTKFSGADHPRYVGLYELTCAHCGEKFTSRRKGRKYCSHEHFVEAQWRDKPKSPEHRAKIGQANQRREWTPESRAKLSATRAGMPSPNKGKAMGTEQRAKISASLTGRKDSDETRAKKAAAARRRTRSSETRAKISASLSGKPKSAEHRAAISASMRSDQTMREPGLT